MNIKQIKLENFKNIKKSTIDFKNNMSGIYGPNGTGKTSIIEAIGIFKRYFYFEKRSTSFPDFISDDFHERILSYMTIEKKFMVIEVVLNCNNYDYNLMLEFKKDKNNKLFISKEEISYKENNTRKKFVTLAKVINSEEMIIPEIYLSKNSKISNNLIEDSLKKINYKAALKNFDKFYSFLFQIYILGEFHNENKLSLSTNKNLRNFILHLKEVSQITNDIVLLTLKDQSLYRDTLIIPLMYNTDNGIVNLEYSNKHSIYNKTQADILINLSKEIGNLLSIIIPNSKFILDDKNIGTYEDGGEKIEIKLFVEKNNQKIPLIYESTGTIKLISLLSVLIFYIKNEKATVFIDELDVHIFEYLLGILLEKIYPLAKGQLVFTGHNLLPMERLNKDSIIIATQSEGNVIYTFMKGVSNSTNIRQKYLKSQVLWSEENIEPLLLNIPALEVFIKQLVL